MTETRNLRVFCPTHEAAFETTAQSAKILCEITGHALSVGFPNAEFWEFCGNCETFAPSRLDKGEKARKTCYGCGGEISKHFVCADCKTVSFECGIQTKGKRYFINSSGIEPDCPGCQTASQNGAILSHQCKEIEAAVFTSRETCPFCLEKTTPAADAPKQTSQNAAVAANSGRCPQCQASNPPNAVFCGKCKHQLKMDVSVAKPGSDVNKTQLLGSLCPNCSTPVPPDSGFCGECGQAVKKAAPPPPPPPPPPTRNVAANTASVDLPISTAPVSTSNTTIRNIALGVGGVFLFIVILAIVSNTSKSSDNSSTYNSNNSSSRTSNSRSTNGNMISTSESNFSVVGRYGYITINVNLRSGPDRRYDDLGTLYQDTRVKILQVAKREDSSDWWEVEVENSSDYGCSSVDSSRCGKDDPSDSTQGWINSKFVVFR